MSKIKYILYVSIVLTILVSFYAFIIREISAVNNDAFNDYVNDDYVSVVEQNIIKPEDIHEISERFDIIVNADGIFYFDSNVEINNLYGSNKACIVPFSAEENDCGFTLILNKTYFNKFYVIDSFNQNTDYVTLNILLSMDQTESFTEYFNDKYGLTENQEGKLSLLNLMLNICHLI